jgi:quinol monooxygenase YgiN
MLIAIVDFETAPKDKDAALDQLLREAAEVRAMPGNLAFRAFADPLIDTRVTVIHEWQDRAAFDGYLASPAFARSGHVLRPMMTGKPLSRRFEVAALDVAA